MSYQKGLLTGLAVSAVVGAGVWFLASGTVGGGKGSPPAVPASVSKTLDESKITTVTLKPEGLKSLGIETGVVGQEAKKRTRVYGGEVTVRPGQAISVAAPLSGVLKAPEKGVPSAGTPVARNQPVFQFLPLLTPEGRANLAASKIDADGQVKTVQTTLDAAKVNLDRAKQLLKDEAGSKRMLEDAQAAYDTAQQSLLAVIARRDLLAKVVGEFDAGTASPIAINAPEDGLLRTISASPGQTVPSGALLFDLVNTDRVWIRVPVYAGDLSHLDPKADAVVTPLAAKPGRSEQTAKSVPAAPSANPLAGTVDLFYELENRESKYSPGHRVSVRLPLDDPDDSLTVPWDAVFHDIHGGTWVYEQLSEGTFTRRRVEVRYVTGNVAYLKPGSAPKPGTVVVTKGTAELFGTEAGFSK
ncbi:efflux RND transporter periplasmic adaptor subunit [Zavarzinella formosa]|uniref:efflux RND transporter periplasmic adaptor subunit n=1 Tax=Zavarzinella formosa TaxID=360055 RepID=UPI000306B8E2|nr:efflux RND transporter periplasmic adaptor subunit [Zavarzinella formosa]